MLAWEQSCPGPQMALFFLKDYQGRSRRMQGPNKANILILFPSEHFQAHPTASENQLSPQRKQEEQSMGLGGAGSIPTVIKFHILPRAGMVSRDQFMKTAILSQLCFPKSL